MMSMNTFNPADIRREIDTDVDKLCFVLLDACLMYWASLRRDRRLAKIEYFKAASTLRDNLGPPAIRDKHQTAPPSVTPETRSVAHLLYWVDARRAYWGQTPPGKQQSVNLEGLNMILARAEEVRADFLKRGASAVRWVAASSKAVDPTAANETACADAQSFLDSETSTEDLGLTIATVLAAVKAAQSSVESRK